MRTQEVKENEEKEKEEEEEEVEEVKIRSINTNIDFIGEVRSSHMVDISRLGAEGKGLRDHCKEQKIKVIWMFVEKGLNKYPGIRKPE
ncbi:hypothetical protein M0802_009309 [Mischocyttarus mexicanus]|nr:hypothetical protein M0802_009309 [Mischocyttarus mexicanus]